MSQPESEPISIELTIQRLDLTFIISGALREYKTDQLETLSYPQMATIIGSPLIAKYTDLDNGKVSQGDKTLISSDQDGKPAFRAYVQTLCRKYINNPDELSPSPEELNLNVTHNRIVLFRPHPKLYKTYHFKNLTA